MTVRVLLLTEDSGSEAHATLEAILRKLLQHVVQHDSRKVAVEAPHASLTKAAHANKWKSRSGADEPAIRALVRAIATRLEQARSFVVFHVDGDCTWNARASSENRRAFEHIVRQRVRALLQAKKGSSEHIARLFVLHPHYSIEAWLYQNDREALRILAEPPCSHGCRAKVEAWKADRALLDEIERPKDTTPCLRDRHNLTLTRGLPIDDVLSTEKSLHEAREHLAANAELCAALEACSSHA